MRLSDVAKASRGAIRIGYVVLALAQYKGFDINSIFYPKCKGDMRISFAMMVNMGLIMCQGDGYALVPHPLGGHYQQPGSEGMGDDQHQPVTLENLIIRMQSFDVHMTSLEGTVGAIHQNINRFQHELSAYFTFQGFHPSPFPSPQPCSLSESFRT